MIENTSKQTVQVKLKPDGSLEFMGDAKLFVIGPEGFFILNLLFRQKTVLLRNDL